MTNFELSRRKLLGSLGAIGAASAGAGAGTFAFFQDQSQSSTNEVTAGTLDLSIHDGVSLEWSVIEARPGGVSSTTDLIMENTGSLQANHIEFDFTNYELEDDDGHPRNSGSWSLSPGPESDTNTVDDAVGKNTDTGAAGMAKYIRVESMYYDPDTSGGSTSQRIYLTDSSAKPDEGSPQLVDTNGNGFIDLDDLAAPSNEDALDGFTPPAPGSTSADDSDGSKDTKLQASLRVDGSMPNKYQGDAVITELEITLNQDSTQNR